MVFFGVLGVIIRGEEPILRLATLLEVEVIISLILVFRMYTGILFHPVQCWVLIQPTPTFLANMGS